MNKKEFSAVITKTLSSNDIGTTKSHQAGILIPKSVSSFTYFPILNQSILNPREVIEFIDYESGRRYKFNYIYYNNKIISDGTRSEYRLTGIRSYLMDMNAKFGDELVFGYTYDPQIRTITLNKVAQQTKKASSELSTIVLGSSVIKLQSGWKVVGK
jgi:hypothetical protein